MTKLAEAQASAGALGINANNSRKDSFSGADLGNGSNNFREQFSRIDRFRMRTFLSSFTQFDGFRKCGRVPIVSHGCIGVRRLDSVVGFAGLSTCGSVWLCPVCNSKIMVVRRLEIAVAILGAEKKGTIAFTAWTLRHNKNHRLGDLMKALSYCWDRVTRDKSVSALRKKLGRYGYVRTVEITYGKNGWHPHIHPLVFFDRKVPKPLLDQLFEAEFRAWQSAAVSLGLEAPQLRAHENKYVVVDNSAEAMADYLSKNTYDTWNITYEMTATQSKESIAGRTPWEIAKDLERTAEYSDLTLWWEYESATRGRKQLLWGRGVKKLFGIGEKTDEEIAEKEIGNKEDTVFYITRTGWATVLKKNIAAVILNILQLDGTGSAIDFCLAQGVEITTQISNVESLN